ncbi:hypothetical protein Lser_V15G44142 [Lactuca serriola]
MFSSDNHGLPKSHGTSFPNEDDVSRYDRGTRDHASLPPPPLINLPNSQVRRLEKFKLTQALLASKHEDGKPVYAHVLEMKSHIDRLSMLGVEISTAKLAMIWRAGQANFSGEPNSQTAMDTGNIGSPKRTKSVIVRCDVPKESICFYCLEKGHWIRSCPNYLRDLRDGRVKTYGSASYRRKERKLKGISELNLIVKKVDFDRIV